MGIGGVGATTSGTDATTTTSGTDATTSGTGATTSGTDATTSGTDATTSGTSATTTTSGTGATTTTSGTDATTTTSGTNLVAPADVIASIQDMLTAVAGAGVPLTQLQSDLYSFLVGSDVTALIQDMLTSVAGVVVPLTQLQSDLYSFLVGIAGMDPVAAAVTVTWIQSNLGGVAGAGLSPAADASVVSRWRLVLSLAGIPGGSLAGNATGVAPLGGIAASIFAAMTQIGGASSLPGLAQSFFRPADSELLLPGSLSALPGAAGLAVLTAAGVLPVSLAALAAVALLGAGGLVILTAAGVRVGYRQAKAGFALRTAGIARFAGPGPLGVVRSGSLVVVRPRAVRVARPGAFSAGCVLDKVA